MTSTSAFQKNSDTHPYQNYITQPNDDDHGNNHHNGLQVKKKRYKNNTTNHNHNKPNIMHSCPNNDNGYKKSSTDISVVEIVNIIHDDDENYTSTNDLVKSFSENDLRVFSNPHESISTTSNSTNNKKDSHNNTTNNIGPIRTDYVTIEAETKMNCKNNNYNEYTQNSFRKKILHQSSAIYELSSSSSSHNKYSFKSTTPGTNTIVVVPSMDLDGDELKRISKGVDLYEERQLYHLLLLSDPTFRVVFLSTRPICQDVVRYYLTLDNCNDSVLNDRLSRLFLLSPGDSDYSMSKLSDKVVNDHKLIVTIREIVNRVSRGESAAAGLNVFCGSDSADDLATLLGLRLLEASGTTLYYGSKQGSREIFRVCNVSHAPGTPDIDDDDLLTALPDAITSTDRQRFIRSPEALSIGIARQIVFKNVKPKMWIIKLNQGFSGKGNATIDLQVVQDKIYFDAKKGIPLSGNALVDAIADDINKLLPGMLFQCSSVSWNGNEYTGYKAQITKLGVIAEAFLEGDCLSSPSVQAVIEPDSTDDGKHSVHLLSTHEQVLNGQVYNGCINPASDEYRKCLLNHTKKIGEELARRGVIGHFATDFLTCITSNPINDQKVFHVSAIEINLRQGGTTHPFATMALLIGGKTDDDGIFRTPDGDRRCYMATDAYIDKLLVGMKSRSFLKILQDETNEDAKRLRWNYLKKTGVIFHILDFVELGKIGFTAIAESPDEAKQLFNDSALFLKQIASSYSQSMCTSQNP